MKQLRGLFDAGRYAEAWRHLYDLADRGDDYGSYAPLLRWRRRLAATGELAPSAANVRIALLGSATTTFLEQPLALAVEATGLSCEIHQAPFDTWVREMLSADSGTAEFAPDVAVVVTTPESIPDWPALEDSEDRVREVVSKVAQHFVDLCRKLHEHAGCDIVLGNFSRLSTRPAGTAGIRLPGEPSNFLAELNRELARRLPASVHIHDVEALAALHGVLKWRDPRYWHLAKQPVSFDCLVPFVRGVAQIISALRGRSSRCVVLDLDNTLWGGVVGDEGADNIRIGPGDPVGEAYAEFQRYLVKLHERGVLLAVCSKNEEGIAREPFRTRREMVLRESHFAAFVANWSPKSQNLRALAARLNIGIDSLLFVDDNPAEREEVRRNLPEVRVVELSDEPADFPRQLDRTGWLDSVALSAEDRVRGRQYQANQERETLRDSSADYESYLRSMNQRAVIAPFDEASLPRITQLCNKTNQFNLTTMRMSFSEVEAVMRSPDHLTACVWFQDRFGDHGLISVWAGRRDGHSLWIDQWLMSCRVFGRGVEQLLCNHVVALARDAGVETIHGVYRPTAKNSPCSGLYPTAGFVVDEDRTTDAEHHFVLDTKNYEPSEVAIDLVEPDDPAGV